MCHLGKTYYKCTSSEFYTPSPSCKQHPDQGTELHQPLEGPAVPLQVTSPPQGSSPSTRQERLAFELQMNRLTLYLRSCTWLLFFNLIRFNHTFVLTCSLCFLTAAYYSLVRTHHFSFLLNVPIFTFKLSGRRILTRPNHRFLNPFDLLSSSPNPVILTSF